MAIVVTAVGVGTNTSSSTVVSGSVTHDSASVFVAIVSIYDVSDTVSGVSGMGLTWNEVPTDSPQAISNMEHAVFVAYGSGSNGAVTGTATGTSNSLLIRIIEITGVIQQAAEADEGATGTSTSSTDDITTVTDGAVIISSQVSARAITSIDDGFTTLDITTTAGSGPTLINHGSGYLILATAGAQTSSYTLAGSARDWAIILIAFEEEAVGGAVAIMTPNRGIW